MEEDSSNHDQVKLSLLPDDVLLNHHRHHHAKPSACPPSLSLSLPPPPFQISQQEHEDYNVDDDPPPPTTTNFLFDHEPHHPRFMMNFLIALTTGLLFISVISTFKTLETANLFPNFVVQSISVKSLTLINPSSSSSSSSSSLDVAASNLAVSLRIENPHRFSLSYSSLKASAFQGCDLLGEFDLSSSDQKVKHLEIGARNSTDLELGFGNGMVRLRVEDWIARDLERDTGIGVASFGMQIVVGEAADEANKLEIRCGTVFLGFSTDPFAGKLLFGPARCWRVTGGTYGSTCF